MRPFPFDTGCKRKSAIDRQEPLAMQAALFYDYCVERDRKGAIMFWDKVSGLYDFFPET